MCFSLPTGYIRAAYGNLRPDACLVATARLKSGLQDLVAHGLAGFKQ